MAEQDDFYDKLPYTLQANQITPEYVIFGTGLQETLIAAYRSKMQGKVGLIIDTEKTYGSSLKTLSFKEFDLLSSRKTKEKMYEFITPESYLQANQTFFTQSLSTKKHRGYSIDIEPCFFLASSMACECLKQADMDKYMDFHLVKSILHIQNSEMKHVPLSKGKIFQSVDLSLLQKKHLLSSLHKLMKIYQKYMNVQFDMNSTKQFDKDTVPVDETLYKQFIDNREQMFLPFLQKMVKKNRKIMNYLTYIICNYQYNYDKDIPEHAKAAYTLRGFIQRFGKFIKSCGIYGQIPYLYVDNGIGDIPQAFSRIASIYASVYILHPKVEITSISKNTEGTFEIVTNLSPDRPILTKEIFYGPTHLELRKVEEQFYQQKILRVFVLAQKCGKEETCPAICFITELQTFVNPIFVFVFDNVSHSCPGNLIMYQFETIVEKESQVQCQEKAERLISVLESTYGEGFRGSIKYYSVFIRRRRYPKKSKTNNEDGVGLNDTMGIDLDPHFDNFIQIVGKQENYFKKENPNDLQQEEYFGDDTKYILNRMDELNIKGQPKVAEAPQEIAKQTSEEEVKNQEIAVQTKQQTAQIDTAEVQDKIKPNSDPQDEKQDSKPPIPSEPSPPIPSEPSPPIPSEPSKEQSS